MCAAAGCRIKSPQPARRGAAAEGMGEKAPASLAEAGTRRGQRAPLGKSTTPTVLKMMWMSSRMDMFLT